MFKFIAGVFALAMDEIKNWIHYNKGSVGRYLLKALIGMFVFVIIRDMLTMIVTKIITGQTMEEVSYRDLHGSKYTRLAFVVLSIIKYLILICLLYEIIQQLNVVEINPLATITISSGIIIILVIQGYFTRKVRRIFQLIKSMIKGHNVTLPDSKNVPLPELRRNSGAGKTIFKFMSLISKLAGLAVAVVIVFIINQGVSYVIDSGGKDITDLLRLPSYKISLETNSIYSFDEANASTLPVYLGDNVRVNSDGKLNIIYINNHQVGINTSYRGYKFFGVSINQAEITAARKTSYKYEDTIKINQNLIGYHSDSYIYYNEERNDCLVLTVNNKSNRVASMTYFTDFNLIYDLLFSNDE